MWKENSKFIVFLVQWEKRDGGKLGKMSRMTFQAQETDVLKYFKENKKMSFLQLQKINVH